MKKIIIKIVKIISAVLLLFCGLVLTIFLLYFFDDKDSCLDTSICKEGLELNTEYGLIKINKENCLKYHWKWDEKSRYCNMRSENK